MRGFSLLTYLINSFLQIKLYFLYELIYLCRVIIHLELNLLRITQVRYEVMQVSLEMIIKKYIPNPYKTFQEPPRILKESNYE